MRLNYNTYPAYHMLEVGEILRFPIDEQLINYLTRNILGKNQPMIGEKFDSMLISTLESMHGVFSSIENKNKFYITETFHDAIQKSKEKLFEAMQTKMDTSSSIYDSCLLMHRMGFAMHQTGKSIDGKTITRFFVFNKQSLIGVAAFDLHQYPNNITFVYLANNLGLDPKKHMMELFHSYMLVLYFIAECEVETMVLKPRQKAKIKNEKYLNESKSPLTVLDCTWYTELIISVGFGVQGHLRWQACGEGRTKRKLIWIDAFEKKGYHRKAKKDNFDA